MKTAEVFKDTNNGPKNTNLKKKCMKTEAFGDKENVTGQCQLASVSECSKSDVMDLVKDKVKRVASTDVHTEKKKLMESICGEKCGVTADDLTKSVPSEQYWKTLAEQQCEALKETLEENKTLYAKIDLLMQENETLKQALQEAAEVIDELNEIVKEGASADGLISDSDVSDHE